MLEKDTLWVYNRVVIFAGVAQSVEQQLRNLQVARSIRVFSSIKSRAPFRLSAFYCYSGDLQGDPEIYDFGDRKSKPKDEESANSLLEIERFCDDDVARSIRVFSSKTKRRSLEPYKFRSE